MSPSPSLSFVRLAVSLVAVSLAALPGCADDRGAPYGTGPDADLAPSLDGAPAADGGGPLEPRAYHLLRPSSPEMTGSLVASQLDSELTRCGDGRWLDACPVGGFELEGLDFSAVDLEQLEQLASEGRLILHGAVMLGGDSQADVLRGSEIWVAGTSAAPYGGFYAVVDLPGSGCDGADCSIARATSLGDGGVVDLDAVSFEFAEPAVADGTQSYNSTDYIEFEQRITDAELTLLAAGDLLLPEDGYSLALLQGTQLYSQVHPGDNIAARLYVPSEDM